MDKKVVYLKLTHNQDYDISKLIEIMSNANYGYYLAPKIQELVNVDDLEPLGENSVRNKNTGAWYLENRKRITFLDI